MYTIHECKEPGDASRKAGETLNPLRTQSTKVKLFLEILGGEFSSNFDVKKIIKEYSVTNLPISKKKMDKFFKKFFFGENFTTFQHIF